MTGQPEIAQFQFRARNEWVSGTHNRTTIQGFYGAGQEDVSRTEPFTFEADHPAVLVGDGHGVTAVESLLHAIAACLTSGVGNIAAARGITLYRVSSTVEGDIDLLGILGLFGRGSQRLPPDPRPLRDRGRRVAGEPRGAR